MRKFLVAVSVFLSFSVVQAADVLCGCQQPDKCSDVIISLTSANPGMYMNIEYAYGEKNFEGFASITKDEKNNQTIYKLGNFVLVEKDDVYTLPMKPQTCS